MDFNAILDTIEELESQKATPESIQELAALYTVRDHSPMYSQYNSSILPTYNTYCSDKRKCQLGQLSENQVLEDLKFVCSEVLMLMQTLYSGTSSNLEREQLKAVIQQLSSMYLN